MKLGSLLFIFLYLPFYVCIISSPPRGWNSWICYRGCINETQFIQNAEAVVKYLKPFDYEYVVVDGGWSSDQNGTQHIDQYGRPIPSADKFPHGFKWLSQQIHNMGLKFGVWVGRGITQTAVTANTPIYGTNNQIHAKDIYVNSKQCPWDKDLYAVDSTKNGSQQFINSLYSLFDEWGVDFIKNDCVFGGNYVPDQIDMVSEAMNNLNNYQFTYSLSPGNYLPPSTFNGNVTETTSEVNMYRITGDCWDKWESNILQHFNITALWAESNYIGNAGRNGLSFPDLDMMPLGYITASGGSQCEPYRYTSLTQSQSRVLFTLWSICRSPLIFGGEVTKLSNDSFTRNLITNKYALNVNMNSTQNKQVMGSYDNNGVPIEVIWSAEGVNNDYYVAFFNVNVNGNKPVDMMTSFDSIGGNIAKYNQCQFTEAWSDNTGTMTNGVVQGTVNSNDTLLFYLHSCS